MMIVVQGVNGVEGAATHVVIVDDDEPVDVPAFEGIGTVVTSPLCDPMEHMNDRCRRA